jgi:hypothetical protein
VRTREEQMEIGKRFLEHIEHMEQKKKPSTLINYRLYTHNEEDCTDCYFHKYCQQKFNLVHGDMGICDSFSEKVNE